MLNNRKAFFNYEILDKYDAGISLKGSEVKRLREGSGDISCSHIMIKNEEAFILGMNINNLSKNDCFDSKRDRKLLLRKKEIRSLFSKSREKQFTIIPIKVFFMKGFAKIQIALAKGLKKYDKRKKIIDKEIIREKRNQTSF
ncbi:SsrA-binding protein SmpB [Candidatus Nesciobacter abundans]|uniref:SsrA-binding protein n=1 Tax=Candidatus Nesciobacter abundans TaxID=2601668 RepID=A0A5C0UIL4_9PROT|nr:SsrA-binding protein SmpB [Candidatus Nesciobacter abundans]QEK39272.1 SsrA-binding protein SmpB [Candidatus Nesciobacter abundans]